MKRNCFYTVLSSVVILFLSCQDPVGLLPTLSTPAAEPGVKSINAGTVVGPKDTLPLSLTFDSSTDAPDLLNITIYRQDDSSNLSPLSHITVSGDELAARPMRPLSLSPDLPRGAYKIEFVLSRNGAPVSKNTVPFFYEPNPYVIQNVRAYPSTVIPGSDGLLEVIVTPNGLKNLDQTSTASVSVPVFSPSPGPNAATPSPGSGDASASDYYVRWWDGDRLLSSGSYKSGYNVYHLTGPEKEGVYTYRVEVFPVAPAVVGDVGFTSSISKDIRVVVGNSDTAVGGFGPQEDFSTLLHFQGNLSDQGWETKADQVFHFEGQRFFTYQADTIGYALGNGTVLVGDKSWLPVSQGLYTSYGLFTRVVPLNVAAGTLLKMVSRNGDSSLVVASAANGVLNLSLKGPGLAIDASSDKPVFVPNTPVQLQVFVSSYGGYLNLVIQDGTKTLIKASKKIALANTDDVSMLTGKTEIGNTDDFRILVDEFGIYRPQPEKVGPDLFSLAMYYRYGESLRLAEDFAGEKTPQGFRTSGDVRFVDSQAMIYGGATLSLPSLSSLGAMLRFDLLFNPQSDLTKTVLTIWASDAADGPEQDPVVLNLSGEINYKGKHLELNGFERNPLTFSIDPKNGKPQLAWAGKTVDLDWVLSDTSKLNIRLNQNSSGPVAIGLDNVLSVSESGQDPIDK